MPEELKDDILVAKIKATKRKIDNLRNATFLGAILFTVFGIYWLYLVTNPIVGVMVTISNILLCVTVAGALLLLTTIILSIRYNRQNRGHYKELKIVPKDLLSSTVCPKCKKNLPEEYEDVCIFCGFDLGIE